MRLRRCGEKSVNRGLETRLISYIHLCLCLDFLRSHTSSPRKTLVIFSLPFLSSSESISSPGAAQRCLRDIQKLPCPCPIQTQHPCWQMHAGRTWALHGLAALPCNTDMFHRCVSRFFPFSLFVIQLLTCCGGEAKHYHCNCSASVGPSKIPLTKGKSAAIITHADGRATPGHLCCQKETEGAGIQEGA